MPKGSRAWVPEHPRGDQPRVQKLTIFRVCENKCPNVDILSLEKQNRHSGGP